MRGRDAARAPIVLFLASSFLAPFVLFFLSCSRSPSHRIRSAVFSAGDRRNLSACARVCERALAQRPPKHHRKLTVLACVCARVLALAFALAQLPPKHHLLLVELDQAGQDYHEHHQKILSKCVSRSIDRSIDRSIVDPLIELDCYGAVVHTAESLRDALP